MLRSDSCILSFGRANPLRLAPFNHNNNIKQKTVPIPRNSTCPCAKTKPRLTACWLLFIGVIYEAVVQRTGSNIFLMRCFAFLIVRIHTTQWIALHDKKWKKNNLFMLKCSSSTYATTEHWKCNAAHGIADCGTSWIVRATSTGGTEL